MSHVFTNMLGFFVYAKSFETSNQADSHIAQKSQTTAC